MSSTLLSNNEFKSHASSFFNIMYIGAYDDPNGSHVSIEVTSALFEGKRPVQRQQLVYKALWEGMLQKHSLHSVFFYIGSDGLLLLTSTEFIDIKFLSFFKNNRVAGTSTRCGLHDLQNS